MAVIWHRRRARFYVADRVYAGGALLGFRIESTGEFVGAEDALVVDAVTVSLSETFTELMESLGARDVEAFMEKLAERAGVRWPRPYAYLVPHEVYRPVRGVSWDRYRDRALWRIMTLSPYTPGNAPYEIVDSEGYRLILVLEGREADRLVSTLRQLARVATTR